ncbi:Fatty acid hydroxylase [Cordyceps militaris]|uniref:Fatty acid hydroxylase n=1 Tax=Cordyceps militaris TaxID=73501 RepID=A0A2H4S9D2_CORMI|nr:Fatty acid hydroxylase [Cordyceps militaris]
MTGTIDARFLRGCPSFFASAFFAAGLGGLSGQRVKHIATTTDTIYAQTKASLPTMSAPPASAKDSMKSTWRTWDRKRWNHNHWILHIINPFHRDLDRAVPVHAKTDKVPNVSTTDQHVWILLHAAVVLAVHQSWLSVTGIRLPFLAAVGYYTAGFLWVVVRQLHTIRELGHTYGFLDGESERDGIPDAGVSRVLGAGWKTAGGRMLLAAYLVYTPAESPLAAMSALSWWVWLPFQIGLYGVVLDFWFYWYHRAMHSVGGLWQFHRTHHLTKHPNAMLSAYADDVQEFFDMVGIPFLTFLTFRAVGIPLGFYDWFVCHQYTAFTEAGGHSGLRLNIQAATPFSPILNYFDAELRIEDHDLHHRKGWRKSHNYGKQTRQ